MKVRVFFRKNLAESCLRMGPSNQIRWPELFSVKPTLIRCVGEGSHSMSDLDPCLFVVFGATGDLVRRKLLPALYKISKQAKLGDRFKIMGVSRSDMDDRAFRAMARTALESGGVDRDESVGRWCEQHLYYCSLITWEADQFRTLAKRIGHLESRYKLPGNRVFYLALPTQMFPPAITDSGWLA
jgi:glucose-6-phosphate 1-dehydrogenase